MREKLISTSVLDILVSSFAFVSIIVAVLTYCIAYFAGQGTSSGGYNMIYLTYFIFFITRTLEICKAIINKDRVKRKKQTGIKIFQAMLTLCSVVSSFAVFSKSFDSIILVFVFGAISAYFWIYDMYIFGIAAADHLNENYDNKKHTW